MAARERSGGQGRTAFDVVVVGGGVAAGACVTTLRELGFGGSIAVACDEPHPPYTRPGLTKQVLRGEKPASAALWRPPAWYDQHGVELLTGAPAADLDPAERRIDVAGRTLHYRSLVIATGAAPVSLDLGAGVGDRVHLLRTFADADRIRPHLGAGVRWLVIGGGFIGAEFAASARLTGSDVTLVLPEPFILERAFGEPAGPWFHRRLHDRGVAIHAGSTVTSLTRAGDTVQALLADGTTVEVDHVCIGVGVRPNIALAAEAGLELAERGIATDRYLLTRAPDVYAIGDVAAFDSVLHGRRVRIEHWDVARAHGAHVAEQIASGEPRAFAELPYFFGTMGDWAFLEYVGTGTGRPVARGSLEGDDLAVAYLDGAGALAGLLTVARPADLEAARELVASHASVDPELVADASVPLAECRLEARAAS
jgi:3-phenylpropionate/trans-cinnamate dioxygenase ferredoxin reductase subunit